MPAPSNHLDWHALILAKCSKLVYRAGLYLSGRVTTAQGPLHGDAISHSFSVEGKTVIQKFDAWTGAPISCPQSYEHAISRMKRDGVEFIVASHILQASPVWSVPLPQECWYWCWHTLVPLHQTLHPWSNVDTPKDVQRTAQSSQSSNLQESPLSVTGLVADNPHSLTLLQSHSYLQFVPLRQWWHILPTQLAQLYKVECPLQDQ